MIALFLLTQPEGGGQVAQIARTFGVDWPHLIAQTISFSIVCALLYYVCWYFAPGLNTSAYSAGSVFFVIVSH